MEVLHGIPYTKGTACIEELTKMQELFEPCHNLSVTLTPITTMSPQPQRVKFTKRAPKVVTYEPDPRVPIVSSLPAAPRLIVASPTDGIIEGQHLTDQTIDKSLLNTNITDWVKAPPMPTNI